MERYKNIAHWVAVEPITGYLPLDITVKELYNTITYMNSADDSHLIPKFIDMTAKLDKLRSENTRAVFPELATLLE